MHINNNKINNNNNKNNNNNINNDNNNNNNNKNNMLILIIINKKNLKLQVFLQFQLLHVQLLLNLFHKEPPYFFIVFLNYIIFKIVAFINIFFYFKKNKIKNYFYIFYILNLYIFK
jgi:hypothetical protein